MKKLNLMLILLLLVPGFLFSQEIQTVTIGNQTWTGGNLTVGTFRNGERVPEAKTLEEWAEASEQGKPMCIVYEFQTELVGMLGKLYNWYAVTDPRGLAPAGWHIPSDAEWTQLADALGGAELATDQLKSDLGWEEDYEGTNESEFDGLPGGKIDKVGIFDEVGINGYWWSSSESEGFGLNRNLSSESFPFEGAKSFKGAGFSVRCLKD